MTIRERARLWKQRVAREWGLRLDEFRTLRRLRERMRPQFTVEVERVPDPAFDLSEWVQRYVALVLSLVQRRREVSNG